MNIHRRHQGPADHREAGRGREKFRQYTFRRGPRGHQGRVARRSRRSSSHVEAVRTTSSAARSSGSAGPWQARPTARRRSSPSKRATRSTCSREAWSEHGLKKYKPTSRRAPPDDGLRLRRDHQGDARRRSSPRRCKQLGRPQHPRPHHHAATRAADTSAATASSTSSADKDGVPAKVAAIEYDPNRTARIALLHYADGEKRYILAPVGLTVGDTLIAGADGRHPAGQRAAAAEHPGRHRHPQRRAQAGQRRADGPHAPAPGAS